MESARPGRKAIDTLLNIDSAAVTFKSQGGTVKAVDHVSLSIAAGETLAIVGESGCGKTTLAKAVLGLQPIESGEILLKGKSVKKWKGSLAKEIGMVWQDPYASLNPRWTIGRSVQEPSVLTKSKCDVGEILEKVGLDPSFAAKFPHELSGGQRQRAVIGRAISLNPSLIICDEPTAALDLSIRAQILNLLKDIQEKNKTSFLYISHDLSTVRFIAKRAAVMYMGMIVEEGPAAEVLSDPRHPYTKALLDSAPTLDKLRALPEPLPGEVPDPRKPIIGCKFAGRCKYAQPLCTEQMPGRTVLGDRAFLCHYPLNANNPMESVGS